MAFDGGTGTALDPYLVSTAIQLNEVRTNLAAHYRQTADINLEDYAPWVPIGNSTTAFSGGYDGGNYRITGLALLPTGNSFGLFGLVTTTSDICNVRLLHAVISLTDAALTGNFNYEVGSLVGKITSGGVVNCHTSVAITSTVASTSKTISNIGGLIGTAQTDTEPTIHISDSSAKATFTIQDPTRIHSAGCLIGQASGEYGEEDWIPITNCQAEGSVSGNARIALFIGTSSQVAFRKCSAIGSVYSSAGLCALFGNEPYACSFQDCYAKGDLTVADFWYVGGFASNPYAAAFTNCYSASTLTVTIPGLNYALTGAFADPGDYDAGATLTNCYYDVDTLPAEVPAVWGVLPATTAEMKNPSSYSGWDFADTWLIDADKNEGYPAFLSVFPLYTFLNVAHYVKQNGQWIAVTDLEEAHTAADISDFAAAAGTLIDDALNLALGGS